MIIKGFSSDWLDELKQKNDILEVVSGYVAMERKGGRYFGRCPFHHEKTPSFTVSSERGFFYCYGCHESGDVITFVSKIENIDFLDTINHLAQRVGMKVPELKDITARASKQEKDKLYSLMRESAKYYHTALKSASKVVKYLHDRNIKDNTIVKFGLGYSPNYNALIYHLKGLGYTQKQMLDAGVAFEKGGDLLDSLGGRLIVPIFDSFGKVVAFGGRALEKDNYAKYKNTRETLIFTKNKVLYGLNFVNLLKRKQKIDDLIIVEGYMDTIALVQEGIPNVIASMGTSLTEQQARIIKNNVDEVYICYDGDAAGQASALRGMDILKTKDLKVRVMSLPEGLDPDEVVSKYGVERFLQYKQEALPLTDYKLFLVERNIDMTTPSGRSEYAKNAINVIAELDEVEKSVYLQVISQKSGIDKKVLQGSKTDGGKRKSTPKEREKIVNSAYMDACRFVLLSKLTSKPYAKEPFERDILENDTHIKIYDYIESCVENNNTISPSAVFELGGEKEEGAAILNCYPKIMEEEEEKYYKDCLITIKKEYYEKLVTNLMDKYKNSRDNTEQAEILKQITEINQKIRREYGK